jgi:hypothetical protein
MYPCKLYGTNYTYIQCTNINVSFNLGKFSGQLIYLFNLLLRHRGVDIVLRPHKKRVSRL